MSAEKQQPEEKPTIKITPESEEKPTIEVPAPQQPETEEKPSPVAPASVDPFEQIGESLSAAKPEKQDYFVKALKEKKELEADQKTAADAGQDWQFLKDSDGRYWSADLCENKADPKTGLPVKTASGLWKLKRGVKSAERKKLPKRPPNIKKKMENAEAEAEAQRAAEAEAARIQQSAIMTTKAVLAGHSAILSQVSGEKAVKDVMGYQIGEGQFKVRISDLLEASGVEMMVKRGGGVSLPPEAIFIGGLGITAGAVYFHPDRPERRATVKEKAGVIWRRLWNGKKNAKVKNEQKKEGGEE